MGRLAINDFLAEVLKQAQAPLVPAALVAALMAGLARGFSGFGSGLIFLTMSFAAGAATQALLAAHAQYGERFFDSGTFAFGGRLAYELTNTYALRMAGVFMFSLATLCQRTGAMPRPFVWVTWALGALLVLGLTQTLWAALLFPLWVLGFSLYLLAAIR